MKSMDSLDSVTHDCVGMPAKGVSIRRDDYMGRESPLWCLFIERQATEEDLENNQHLEDVGQAIWMTAVEIKFCPYCGKELTVAKFLNSPSDFGRFVHIDSSGWTDQRQ